MVEIFWIVLDKLNKQTLDIFQVLYRHLVDFEFSIILQGRTRTNVKFINSADFRKEFEKNMECHRWGGIGADLPELPLLPINQGRFI